MFVPWLAHVWDEHCVGAVVYDTVVAVIVSILPLFSAEESNLEAVTKEMVEVLGFIVLTPL